MKSVLNGVWVETEGMKENLLKSGFENVEIFPNQNLK